MHIYTYWVNQPGSSMPDYLKLCMQTWIKAIPGVKIVIINHDNIRQYLPGTLLSEAFFNLPLAMQSDVVSVWVLLSRGGMFIDVDTIMTANPFATGAFNEATLYAFGYQQRQQIHLAILFCQRRQNPLLYQWITEIGKRLAQPLPSPLPWDWVGNSIINPLLRKDEMKPHYEILEAQAFGNILELSVADENPWNRYIKFWFTPPAQPLNELLARVKGGSDISAQLLDAGNLSHRHTSGYY